MGGSVLASVALPAATAVIMCNLGMTLTTADFRRVVVAPRGVAIGMLNMTLIAPLLALGTAELFDLRPQLAVGLVLLSAAPAGMSATMFTHLSRGDTALSVTMTALSSVGAILTVPLYLSLAASHFGASEIGQANMPGVIGRVFAITIVPVVGGVLLRRHRPQLVASIYPSFRNLSLGLFGFVVVGAIVSGYRTVAENLTAVGGAALTLNLVAMSVGLASSKLTRLTGGQGTAISLEVGIRNAPLAVAVGASLAASLAVPAAVYAAVMVTTGGGFTWAMSRRNAGLEAREPVVAPAAAPALEPE